MKSKEQAQRKIQRCRVTAMLFELLDPAAPEAGKNLFSDLWLSQQISSLAETRMGWVSTHLHLKDDSLICPSILKSGSREER